MKELRIYPIYVVWLLLTAISVAQEAGQQPGNLPLGIDKVSVKTASLENSEVPFFVRPPKGLEPRTTLKHRVLFICPILNGDGLKLITSNTPLSKLADQKSWFIVVPTFQQKNSEVQDRTLSYYYPETFSGKAVLDALDLIKQKYPIVTDGLLLQGCSGGAQFVHRFAIWAPERVAAVVVNSSSWFDSPTPKCASVAWLVTIGEADPSYNSTLDFVEKLKNCGVNPIFRSYVGMVHGGANGEGVPKLDTEFLAFYDQPTRPTLGLSVNAGRVLPPAKLPFVGDVQDWRYYPNTAENVQDIPETSRIYLPSEPIAKSWGEAEQK